MLKKKYSYIVILLLTLIVMPVRVFAAGNINVSNGSLTINKGKTATFTVSASNATGRVDISSSDPSVASVNVANKWLDNDSVTVTVTGKKAGTARITIALTDVATYDGEELSGSRTVTVTVKEPTTSNSNKPSNSNSNKPSNTNTNSNSNSNTKSTNNNLKSITVEGYTLKKEDNNNYSLEVTNNVSKINVIAEAEDEKATVTGNGTHNINIGNNTITVTITSESGAQNKIYIKVNRKAGFDLNDLDEALKGDGEINITIKDDSILTKQQMEKIKTSKKTVNLNYIGSDGKLKYSWIIDGKEIGKTRDFYLSIIIPSTRKRDISKQSNYAEGISLTTKDEKEFPGGFSIKLYVGDKYENDEEVNAYYFDKSTFTLIKGKHKVQDGYITFEADKGSHYFVSLWQLKAKEKSKFNIFMVISVIEFVIIALLVMMIMNNNQEDHTKKWEPPAGMMPEPNMQPNGQPIEQEPTMNMNDLLKVDTGVPVEQQYVEEQAMEEAPVEEHHEPSEILFGPIPAPPEEEPETLAEEEAQAEAEEEVKDEPQEEVHEEEPKEEPKKETKDEKKEEPKKDKKKNLDLGDKLDKLDPHDE